MRYQVVIPKPVQKQLDDMPDDVNDRIIKRIAMLKERPRPRGCIKLKGYENEYRIRIGNYRIRYETWQAIFSANSLRLRNHAPRHSCDCATTLAGIVSSPLGSIVPPVIRSFAPEWIFLPFDLQKLRKRLSFIRR